jgi:hypothetical protein
MAPSLDSAVTLSLNDLMLFSCGDLRSLRAESLTKFPVFVQKLAPLKLQAKKAEKSLKRNGIILGIGFIGCAIGIPGLAELHNFDLASALLGIIATGGAGVLIGGDSLELLQLKSQVKAISIPAAEYKNFILRCDLAVTGKSIHVGGN